MIFFFREPLQIFQQINIAGFIPLGMVIMSLREWEIWRELTTLKGGRYYLLMLVARESEIAISQCMFGLHP